MPATPVRFGASAPENASPASTFVARFAAYPADSDQAARALLHADGPRTSELGLGNAHVENGAVIEVVASGTHLSFDGAASSIQQFVWTGAPVLLAFAVKVAGLRKPTDAVLQFDVRVAGVTLARIPLAIPIVPVASARSQFTDGHALPKTAFASYSSKDRARVLDRVTAIRIAAQMDIFVDCHDINPSEQWRPRLEREIDSRDAFLLFWSEAAAMSPWVKWECGRALKKRGADAIQIHPLENDVKPPRGFKHVHVNDPYLDLRRVAVERGTASQGGSSAAPASAADDDALVVRFKQGPVDDIPLGILRFGLNGRVTYANRAALDLVAPGVAVGSALEAFALTPESEGVVRTQMDKRRRTERGGCYPVTLNRPDLQTLVYAQVSAVPEYDEDGVLIGSVGFLNDLTVQTTTQAIHEAIGLATDGQELMEALDRKLRNVLAFDSIGVYLINDDRSAIRTFYARPQFVPEHQPAWRWWPMPKFVKADLDSLLTARADDVRALFGSVNVLSARPISNASGDCPSTRPSTSPFRSNTRRTSISR